MSKTAKLFRNGNSQAVRLPQEFRFKGDEVRIRKEGDAVVLEPMFSNTKEWFAAIDSYAGSDAFEGNGRDQRKARLQSAFEDPWTICSTPTHASRYYATLRPA